MHVFAQLMKRFTNAKLKSRNLCFIWKIRSLENVLFYLKAGIVREKRSDIAATCTHHKMFFFSSAVFDEISQGFRLLFLSEII